MNSKMKSTFAIIAVALMVLVAVVPMVGVFSENSVATDVDPTIDGNITIAGKIYKASGAPETAAGTNYVKVVFGSYTLKAAVDNNGAYSVTIQETSVASVVLTYVDKDGNAVKDFSPVTLTGLSKGNYTADFKAGNISAIATLYAKNGTTLISSVVGETITANFVAYTLNDETYTKVSEGAFNKNGTATVFYPYSAQNYDLYVTVSGFSATGVSGTPITFAEKQKFTVANTGTAMALRANENIVTVSVSDQYVLEEFTVTEMYTGTPEEKTPLAMISNKIKYGAGDAAVKAYFTTAADLSGKVAMVLTAGNGTQATLSELTLSPSVEFAANLMTNTYTTSQMFFGTVKLSTYTQDGTLAITTVDSTSVTSPKVDKDGNFLTFVPAEKKIKALTFTTGTGNAFSKVQISGADIPEAGYTITSTASAPVTIVDATYAAVTGNLYLLGGTTGISDKSLVATATTGSVKIFGYTVTGANGAFGFMATKDVNVTMKPSDASTVAYTGDINFVVGTESTGLVINMATQDISVKISEALGAAIGDTPAGKLTVTLTDGTSDIATLGYNADKDKFKATIRGDITPTNYKIYINDTSEQNKSGYTFANSTKATAIAYEKDKAYASKEATYKLTFYKADGVTKLTTVTNANAAVYTASAYKNSTGSIVYDDISANPITTPAGGVYTFTVNTSLLGYTKATISTTPVNIVFVKEGQTGMSTLGIFDKYYVLSADSVDDDGYGIVSIVASVDSITGKLTRLGSTDAPISGVKVQATDNNGNVYAGIDAAYTQEDGTFTLYSDVMFKTTDKVLFTKEGSGYVFGDAKPMFKNEKKVTAYTPDKDIYAFAFIDADDAAIPVTVTQPEITDATFFPGSAIGNIAGYQAAYKEVRDISITLEGRSFEDHTLTAEEMKTGLIGITSNQMTYTFYTYDANDKPLDEVVIDLYTYHGDQAVYTAHLTATAIDPITKLATTSVLLPYCGGTTPDMVGTEYAYLAQTKTVPATPTTPAIDYEFDTSIEDIDDADMIVESTIGLITVKLRDAAGFDREITPNAVTIYEDDVAGPTVYSMVAGKFTFYGDPLSSYTYTVGTANASLYSFVPKSEDVDGFLFAQEETLNGALMDADGTVIPFSKAVTITPVLVNGATSKVNAATLAIGAKSFGITVNTDDVKKYAITVDEQDDYFGVYTFSDFSSTYMMANEETVMFSAVTANGVGLNATFANMQAYDLENKPIAKKAIDGGIIVDADKAVYYEATVTSAGYTFDKKSLLPLFIANESFLTGSVPYSGSGTQGVTLELYLNDNLVQEIKDNAKVKIVDNYYYEAILDLSGYAGDISGVEFDTILVVYYENGVEVGYVSVDPYTAVNNIIPPTYEVYTVQLLPPSILVASHVGIERVGDTVTVTADGNFMIADDEGVYTDGQYTYTFAGWYINNQKVSTTPVYTFELTDDVVISPQYTVTYEKTSDANDKQTPQPTPVQPDNSIDTNVLIIGICAVIVALIAVVYAVIKKE